MMFSNLADPSSGQTHVHCRRYIHLLKLGGLDVTFVELRGVDPVADPNVSYRRYPRGYRRFEKVLGTRTTYYLRDRSMRRLWRRIKPDICHMLWINDQLWHTVRAGLRPLVATAWGSDLNLVAEAAPDDPLRQKLAAALGQLDLLIIDSDEMAATAERLAGKTLRTTLLPIGIDTGLFRPGLHPLRQEWREKLKINLEAIVLISPRQLGANYRPAEIIRAFSALNHRIHGEYFLIMRTFGHQIGVSLLELRALADKLRVSDRVRWVGEVEYTQLPGLYAASDLAINFPIMDAFPVTFLECFSSGLPVITNRLTSYNSNGVMPYLFCSEDDSVIGLKAAIESGLDHLTELKKVAARAREHIVRNYDERLTARTLKQSYEELLMQADVLHGFGRILRQPI
jgi:glycosyltransferase involved in cell wall biosynthesis